MNRRDIKLSVSRQHAEQMLQRLYKDRYDDVEETTVAFRMPVDKAIEELEKNFPELKRNWDDD